MVFWDYRQNHPCFSFESNKHNPPIVVVNQDDTSYHEQYTKQHKNPIHLDCLTTKGTFWHEIC